MQLPKRWGWWLSLGGLCLALFGAAGVLLLESLTPDPVRVAFRRVQLGMTINEVDAVIREINRVKTGRGGENDDVLFPDEQLPVPMVLGMDTVTAYGLESGQITVLFRDDRAIGKYSARYKTVWWHSLRDFLKRVRAAAGL